MSKPLDHENLNEKVKKCQYTVRGELYLWASEFQKEGKKIIFTNIGNPHALGQRPLTFPRKVIALCQAPFLLDDPNVGLIFPADAIAKAKHYLSLTLGGLGAYTYSRGIPGIRKEVAEFIERRDGYPSDPELIFLTDGASKGVMQILNATIRGEVYSATISLLDSTLVPYFLEETANWGLDVNNLRQSVAQAHYKGITVRAMVIINSGNPIGQCLSEANLKDVLKFCYQENLVLLGDEVYQQNIYQDERPFISARKTGLMVNPPKPGDISYERFVRQSKGILESLRKRAHVITDGFYSCRNVVCNFTEGAMYSFPQIRLPPKAIGATKKAGKVPGVFYCLKLLEATGISTVFGQKEGVFHLRTTILPAEEDMPAIVDSFKKLNDEFMEQ
ncbi:hypothetical protein ACH5RR_030728 [Cinchona calisaya]|uniref:Aminotransferase class I/classII large domain-containing protein n=1 Tax=Cinchona calisaya TaxID=153742 RepID=A0ABD2YYN1_9GENT